MKHQQILKIIRAIRLSFLEAGIVYTQGACYGFYTILKAIYPTAEAYMTENKGHIISKIENRYYDIQGECIDVNGEPIGGITKLTKKQHEYWESVISTQRVETILKKE